MVIPKICVYPWILITQDAAVKFYEISMIEFVLQLGHLI